MTTTDPTAGPRTDRARGSGGYLQVLRTPGMLAWFAVAVCQRLPIAMAPLALVLLGEAAVGSFSVGAVLAGVFALAEAATAAAMGRRFDRRPPAPELRLVLAVQAVALLLVVGAAQVFTGAVAVVLMTVLAAVAGAVAAGAHGGLRALVVRSVRADARHQALSLEATMTAVMWAIGPALVAGLAVVAGAAVTVVVTGLIALAGVVAAAALVDPGRVRETGRAPSVWRRSWPAMLHECAVLLVVGAVFTALPPLLAGLGGDPGLSGLVLGGFAAAGIVGGVVYGARRWSAPYRVQITVLILALCASLAAGAWAGDVLPVVLLVLVGGLFSTPALTARGAGLQELLPESRWSAGFSTLYAAGGIGFGVAGLVVAPLLVVAGGRVALAVCAGVAAVMTVVGTVAENRTSPRAAGAQ